jgi:hypothetical protein
MHNYELVGAPLLAREIITHAIVADWFTSRRKAALQHIQHKADDGVFATLCS